MDDVVTTITKANVADTADTRRRLLMVPERICIDIMVEVEWNGMV